MTVDTAFVEGFVAGLGWGLLVGAGLGVRWLFSMIAEAGKGGERS